MENSGPDNGTNQADGTEALRNYLGLPAEFTEEFNKDLRKARETRSELDLESSENKLELHILRAVDPEQLKADTFAVCSKLISEGVGVVPVTKLSPDSMDAPGEGPAVHLIWEGHFRRDFTASGFIAGLIHGNYSSRLKGRIVIISMSWNSFEKYFGRKDGRVTEITRMPASVGTELRIGMFLLGIAMLLSVASPFLVSGDYSGISGAGAVIGDIALASTVAGLILVVAGIRADGFVHRVRVYIIVSAFIAVYAIAVGVLATQPVYGSSSAAVTYGTSVSVGLSVVFFLFLLTFSNFRRSLVLYSATGFSMAYALYSGLSAYLSAVGSPPSLVQFSGFVAGSNSFFSFSISYLDYGTPNAAGLVANILFIIAAILFAVTLFWTSMDLDWENFSRASKEAEPAPA